MKLTTKTAPVRKTAKPVGRPRKYPACPRYDNKSHRFTNGRCACGYQKPKR